MIFVEKNDVKQLQIRDFYIRLVLSDVGQQKHSNFELIHYSNTQLLLPLIAKYDEIRHFYVD